LKMEIAIFIQIPRLTFHPEVQYRDYILVYVINPILSLDIGYY
jgi:hypothetical protein